MNLNRIILAMFLILSPLPILGQQAVSARDWQPIPNSNSEFDASSVTRISQTIIRVREKCVYSEKILNYMRKTNPSQDYSDYSHTINSWQIDCNKQTNGLVNSTVYNSRGAVIGYVYFEDLEMFPVVRDTNGERLVRTICNYVKRVPKKKEMISVCASN